MTPTELRALPTEELVAMQKIIGAIVTARLRERTPQLIELRIKQKPAAV